MTPTKDTLWGGKVVLWQPARGQGYRFNIDPVLLSSFAQPGRHTLDLGAGCGVLGILLLASGKTGSVTAVEVQPALAELARRNAEQNGVGERMQVLCGDLRELTLPAVDRVVFNPPYFRAGAGRGAPEPGRDLGRHERRGTLADFVARAAESLVPAGVASAIVPVARAEELRGLLAGCGLQPVRERPVHPRQGKPQSFVLLSARKCGSEGWRGEDLRDAGEPDAPRATASTVEALRVEPPLLVHSSEGNGYSEEVESLLSGP